MNDDILDESAGDNLLVNTGGRPSYTYMADWGWMCPDVSDQGWRYYSCIRAFIFDKPAKWTIEITDETVASLLHRSVRSVARARQDCYKAGLVEEVEYTKRSVAIPGQLKREVRTFRKLRVAHEPSASYTGPVNCFVEKERIEEAHQAAVERAREDRQRQQREEVAAKKAADKAKPARRVDSPNLSSQAEQGEREAAGRSDSTDLSSPLTNLTPQATDLSQTSPSDLRKHAPQQVVEQVKTTNPPELARAASAELGSRVGGSADGQAQQTSLGARLLESLPQAPGKSFIKRYAPKVDALLDAGWPESELVRRWTANTGPVDDQLAVLSFRISDLGSPPQVASARRRIAPEDKVAALVKRGPEGAREAARLLGMRDWEEPDRGDQPAQVYLLETRPAAAREFIDEHREQLLSVLGS